MDPFSTPTLVLVDGARLIVGVFGLLLGAYQLALVRQARTPGQRARLAATAVALGALSYDRIDHVGTALTWELMAATVAVLLWTYGTLKWRDEVPSLPRPARGTPSR